MLIGHLIGVLNYRLISVPLLYMDLLGELIVEYGAKLVVSVVVLLIRFIERKIMMNVDNRKSKVD